MGVRDIAIHGQQRAAKHGVAHGVALIAALVMCVALLVAAPVVRAQSEAVSPSEAHTAAPFTVFIAYATGSDEPSASVSTRPSGNSTSDEGSADAEDATNANADPIDGLSDGKYQIDVTMTGGSGKASIESPALMEIEKGKPYATLVWSSEYYDYMLVNGKKVKPVTTNPTSTFKVPIQVFDEAYEMVADTTAMGQPHEITYKFTFDSSSIKSLETEKGASADESSDSKDDTKASDAKASSDDQSGALDQADDKPLDSSRIMLLVTVGSLVLAAIAIGVTISVLLAYRQRR